MNEKIMCRGAAWDWMDVQPVGHDHDTHTHIHTSSFSPLFINRSDADIFVMAETYSNDSSLVIPSRSQFHWKSSRVGDDVVEVRLRLVVMGVLGRRLLCTGVIGDGVRAFFNDLQN